MSKNVKFSKIMRNAWKPILQKISRSEMVQNMRLLPHKIIYSGTQITSATAASSNQMATCQALSFIGKISPFFLSHMTSAIMLWCRINIQKLTRFNMMLLVQKRTQAQTISSSSNIMKRRNVQLKDANLEKMKHVIKIWSKQNKTSGQVTNQISF